MSEAPGATRWPKVLPTLTEEQVRIAEDFRRHWLEKLGAGGPASRLLERFNHRYPLRTLAPGGRTLEIGAGIGAPLAFEGTNIRQEYVALELRADHAEVIKRHYPEVRVIVGDCQERIESPDGYFDRAVAIHVLEHLPDLPRALDEIRRVLRPGGSFSVVIPCEGGFAYQMARNVSARRVFERRYHQSYDWFVPCEHVSRPDEIVAELCTRFRIVHTRYFPFLVPLVAANLFIGLTLTKPSDGGGGAGRAMRSGARGTVSATGKSTDGFSAYQYEDLRIRSEDLYARTKYAIVFGYLSGQRGIRILNAGCGSGELSVELARAGHEVVGIDPTPEYIDLARATAARAGAERCRFEVSSIETFAADRPFDRIVATDVLEHIEDDRGAFARLLTLARPGGTIIVTVPAGPWLFGYHDVALGHFRRYTRRRLLELPGPGCRVEEIRYLGFGLIPFCFLYSKLLRRPYPVAEAGNARRRPFVAMALRLVLALERALPMPAGTSLIMKAARAG